MRSKVGSRGSERARSGRTWSERAWSERAGCALWAMRQMGVSHHLQHRDTHTGGGAASKGVRSYRDMDMGILQLL